MVSYQIAELEVECGVKHVACDYRALERGRKNKQILPDQISLPAAKYRGNTSKETSINPNNIETRANLAGTETRITAFPFSMYNPHLRFWGKENAQQVSKDVHISSSSTLNPQRLTRNKRRIKIFKLFLPIPTEILQPTRMKLRLWDILPQVLLAPPVRPRKLGIPLVQMFLHPRKLLRFRETGHELWLAKWQFIAPVNLPEVIDLAVELNDLFHFSGLGLVPSCLGNQSRRLGHYEHAGFDFEDVRVPEFALLCIEGLVERGGNHVLDAEDAGPWVGTVVQNALSDVLIVKEGRVRGCG